MRLGMGLENQFRSQGIGSALLKASLERVKSQEAISWIDLSKF
jgi:ribosomal protein S18 acetylase RimI-like enzyme